MFNDLDEFPSLEDHNNNNCEIDTNGINKYSNYYYRMSYTKLRELFTCIVCNKLFNKDMSFGKNKNENICYHCLMNKLYGEVDSYKINKYIKKCSKEHDKNECNKNKCYLCEYLNNKLNIDKDNNNNYKFIIEL